LRGGLELYKTEKWWITLNNCKFFVLELIKKYEGTETAKEFVLVMNWLTMIEQEVLKLRKK